VGYQAEVALTISVVKLRQKWSLWSWAGEFGRDSSLLLNYDKWGKINKTNGLGDIWLRSTSGFSDGIHLALE
jgi:hypothetical protein